MTLRSPDGSLTVPGPDVDSYQKWFDEIGALTVERDPGHNWRAELVLKGQLIEVRLVSSWPTVYGAFHRLYRQNTEILRAFLEREAEFRRMRSDDEDEDI